MLERTELLSSLFDDKTVKVLQKLLLKQDVFFLRDLSRESGVSLATTFRIAQRLKEIGLIAKEKHDKVHIYRIVRGSSTYREIYGMIFGERPGPLEILKNELKARYKEQISTFLPKDKENTVFVISNSAKGDDIAALQSKILEKTGVTLAILTVTPHQFKQMRIMGLIEENA